MGENFRIGKSHDLFRLVEEGSIGMDIEGFRKKMRSAIKGNKENDGTIPLIETSELQEEELEVWNEFENIFTEVLKDLNVFLYFVSNEDRNREKKEKLHILIQLIEEFEKKFPKVSDTPSQTLYYEWIKNRLNHLSLFIQQFILDTVDYNELKEEISILERDSKALFS